MAKQKKAQQPRQELAVADRLGLRVSAMINSPKAQLERTVTIHRLDTDSDEAWDGVMELLSETDGLEMTVNDDGGVTLAWEKSTDDDVKVEAKAIELVEEEPAPF